LWQSKEEVLGGSVKRSLAMAFLGCGATIAKACGLDDATRPDCHFFVVHPMRSIVRQCWWPPGSEGFSASACCSAWPTASLCSRSM